MPKFILEMEYFIEFNGPEEEAQALRDRLDEMMYDAMPIWCGDPECCPGPQPDHFVSGGTGSSRILTEEEFNADEQL